MLPPKIEPPDEAVPPNADVDELPKILPVGGGAAVVVTEAVPNGDDETELVAPNTD